MYKYLLFDLDGTLTDSSEGILKTFRHTFRTMGVPEPPEEVLREFLGPPLRSSFFNVLGDDSLAEKAVAIYRERYIREGLYENYPYPGVAGCLSELKKAGCVLAVATLKAESLGRRALEHFGLDTYFDYIAGASSDGARDTKCAVINRVFEHLSITDKSQVLMIGDRNYDMTGAKEAGVASMGVLYGYGSREELTNAGADYIAADFNELIQLCRALPD